MDFVSFVQFICPTLHSFAQQTFSETEMSQLNPWFWKFRDESSLGLVLRGQGKPDKETALVTPQESTPVEMAQAHTRALTSRQGHVRQHTLISRCHTPCERLDIPDLGMSTQT